MCEEFNIFKNLEDLKKTSILEQLKSLETSESVDPNDSDGLENDDFDFGSVVNSNSVKKTPSKRQQKKSKNTTPEEQKKSKSRRSSITRDSSISPTMPLLANLSKKVDDMPVGRRTRSSVSACKQIMPTDTISENVEPSTSVRGRSKGKGRARGRGRGRGRGNTTTTSSELHISESFQPNASISSSAEVSGYGDLLDQDNMTLSIMERFLRRGRHGRQRVMRGRRQCIAEIAARSTQVDYVDLVSSPMPRVEGFIDLDSDTEETSHGSKTRNPEHFPGNTRNKKINDSTVGCLDTSFDDDNPELNIKVNWKGKLEAFKLRKHQKFCSIFEQLAERENISIDSIVFNLNDRIIMSEDTPYSINYKVFQFIDGRVLTNRFNSSKVVATGSKKRDPNQITLKVQSDKWKRPLQIHLMKTDKFRILYIKCAEELKVGVDQLKLSFDGELLEPNDNPMDLDLEGGEAIDLRIKE